MSSEKRKPARVTLATVAERAGVSTATVSLILSEREEYLRQFHPDTIAKVRESAEKLGYRTNIFASSLPTKASHFFAVVLHDLGTDDSSSWHHWAFEGDLLAGIIQAAAAENVFPILATVRPDVDEPGMGRLRKIVDGGVFGTIVRTPNAVVERYIRSKLKQGQPAAVVFPSQISRWPTNAIDVDNTQVGTTAGRLLALRGRRKWGIVRFKEFSDTHKLRCAGFEAVAAEVGASVQVLRLPMDANLTIARDIAAEWLRRVQPDGLFTLNSVASVGTLMGGLHNSMQPMGDFDQVGCDCAMWYNASHPRITSVDISWKDVGRQALQTISHLAEAGESEFPSILMKPRVVAAQTCPVPLDFAPHYADPHEPHIPFQPL